jgi:hypothetical protein
MTWLTWGEVTWPLAPVPPCEQVLTVVGDGCWGIVSSSLISNTHKPPYEHGARRRGAVSFGGGVSHILLPLSLPPLWQLPSPSPLLSPPSHLLRLRLVCVPHPLIPWSAQLVPPPSRHSPCRHPPLALVVSVCVSSWHWRWQRWWRWRGQWWLVWWVL